jgi:protein SCO1/2
MTELKNAVARTSWRSATIATTIAVVLVFSCGNVVLGQRFSSVPYGTPAGSSPTAELIGSVGIEQHLGAQLPLDTVLRDEQGREIKLGDFFKHQPVIVMLVYFRCPMLCTQVLNGFLKSSQAIPLVIGRDYQVVTVSFDPRETPDLAAEKKESYVHAYRREGAAEGWHFLTGDLQSIDKLTKAIGFQYRFDPKSGQFAHASGIALATPDGRLSRYFYGIEYEPDDLRLGLVESSSGRIGSLVDQVLLLCYHYDPLTGKYGLVIAGVLRTAGALTVILVGGYLVAMFRFERRRTKLLRDDDPITKYDPITRTDVAIQIPPGQS